MFKIDSKANFSIKRKGLASSYSTLNNVRNFFGNSRRSSPAIIDITSFVNGVQLDPYFKSPGTRPRDCSLLSNTLYDTNRIYNQLLNYLTNMYYWRYVVTPRRIKKGKISKEEYAKMYGNMLEYVEGISIETVFPALLLNIFKNGKVNFCVNFNSSSKTINTIILPEEYCKPTFTTQYGTQEIMFDFSFFDSLGLKEDKLEELFDTFPKEFLEKYLIYQEEGKKQRWQTLNAKHATSISLNEEGFPTFLSVFYDIIDYKNYKYNEMDRNTNLLERLVVQEIDLEKSGLDMAEIQDLHDSMAEVVCANKGSILLSTPGTIKVEQLQEDIGQENKTLVNAYRTIYDNAGFNNYLFAGDSESSLDVSLKRDANYVWGYIEKLSAFYNLAINNGKNFGDYQISLKLLPITPYNENEKLETLHQAATLGVNVVDYIVATGGKQVDLESTLELEEFLDLTNRLVPLQSSHTQSLTGKENDEKGKSDKPKADEPAPSKEDADKENKNSKEDEEKE